MLLVGEHISTFSCSPSYYTEDASTIEEEMFIVIDDPSGINIVVTRTFIVLDGTPKADDGITVSIEGLSPAGVVPVFPCPMDAPPKPPNMVPSSKSSVRSDQF